MRRLALAALALSCACPSRPAPCVSLKASTLRHAGVAFDVVCVPPDAARLRVHEGSPSQTIEELRAKLEAGGGKPYAITNAGIFEPDHRPTGLLVAGGREVGKLNVSQGHGNFFLQPNGVLVLAPAPAIVETSAFAASPPAASQATQSGPLLVSAGKIHPKLSRSSSNKALRSGAGVDSGGRLYLAISREETTFWSLATLFRDALGCPDALYLDGTISELWAPSLGRTAASHASQRFSGLISVEAR